MVLGLKIKNENALLRPDFEHPLSHDGAIVERAGKTGVVHGHGVDDLHDGRVSIFAAADEVLTHFAIHVSDEVAEVIRGAMRFSDFARVVATLAVTGHVFEIEELVALLQGLQKLDKSLHVGIVSDRKRGNG